jgi:multiple sugar transport system substrate-binding protein
MASIARLSFYRLWICLLVGFFLTACGDESGRQVTFMVFGDPAERDAYLILVNAFHEVHPEITVQLIHVPSPRDYRTRLVTEFAGGDPPAVTLMNYRRYAAFAARDLLEPLGPFVQESDLIQMDDFYPATIDAFMWRGQLMCIPQNISSLVVYYNVDLYAAAGLPAPADDWSWDDFVAAAKTLTRDLDGDGRIDQYGLGLEPSLFRLAPFIWQNEGPLVNDLEYPSRLTLTRPPALAALQWFVDLRQVHHVAPDRVEEAAQDSESRFIAGRTAMFLNSRRGTPAYRQIETFRWDVAPLPRGKTAAGILHSDAYCLSKAAADPEAAWAFIEFANSVQGQSIIAGSGRTVPSLIAVAESPAFLESPLPPARAYVFLESAAIARRVPVISTWQEIEDVASQEIERAFYGDISAQEAAGLADQRTEEYFLLAALAGSSSETPPDP